jgi:hypothetical protein
MFTRMRGWWQSPPEAGRSWVPEEELSEGVPVDGHKVGYRGDKIVE